jgi:hypothetical protein
LKGRIFAPGTKKSAIDRPRLIRIDHSDIGVGADGKRAFWNLEDSRRIYGHLFDQVQKREDAVGDKPERQGKRGFESRQAACRIVEFDFLVGSGVRGMIAGDDIKGPVGESIPDGFTIFNAPERRVDFGVSVETADRLIGQGKVMGRGFGGDANTAGLRFADEPDGTGGAYMGDVYGSLCEFGEEKIPGDHDVFGDSRDAGKPQFR